MSSYPTIDEMGPTINNIPGYVPWSYVNMSGLPSQIPGISSSIYDGYLMG